MRDSVVPPTLGIGNADTYMAEDAPAEVCVGNADTQGEHVRRNGECTASSRLGISNADTHTRGGQE